MERTDSGKYPDEILAEKLKASRKMPAGAFGGTQIPAIFEPIEILGIEHGRKIGVCTLNEYRKFLGLRPFKDFNEMNPKLANELKELYKKVDNVELYPGIVAEEAKPAGPAAGLCTGYTATFAILSDAIALVRGDRFLTMDANPYNLTNWGVAETTPDLKKHFGNILGIKLFNRHLDNARLKDLGLSFPLDDIHTHYMFSTPEEIQKYISLLRKGEKPQEIRKPKRMVDHQNRPLMSEATGPGSNGVLRGAVGIDGIRTA
ncbi:heme peroxidase [Saitoella complicata NRRL Y-17804]|nr:heme peroxidase [Saitoella complicata NRRL Y-17804]ODQ56016.1 heme peroxidase [Saitoella complicata NRRL Y-17804]